jgi:hypothetical protein
MTLKAGIERILADRVPWVTQVHAVGTELEPTGTEPEPTGPGLGDIPGFDDW